MKYYLSLIFTIIMFAMQAQDSILPIVNHDSLILEIQKQKSEIKAKMTSTTIQYFIIKGNENSYGYAIFLDGQMYIEQKTIPGRSGTKGFESITQAEKCANLVIEKMKQGEMPPTVEEGDLKNIIGKG